MNFIDKLVQKYSSTQVAFVISIIIYLIAISTLSIYFNYKNDAKAQNFVKKNEKSINVSLKSFQAQAKKQKAKQSKKETNIEKRPTFQKKDKIVKKQKVKSKKLKPKKIKKEVKKSASDLFKNIKPTKVKKEISKEKTKSKKIAKSQNKIDSKIKKKKSASQLIDKTLKDKKETQIGVEDKYLSSVQEILQGWPAQSEYEGEKVKVLLYIKKNGMFEYTIKSLSNNKNFNQSLKDYLNQLKRIGLGPHKGSSTYKIEVEFIAK